MYVYHKWINERLTSSAQIANLLEMCCKFKIQLLFMAMIRSLLSILTRATVFNCQHLTKHLSNIIKCQLFLSTSNRRLLQTIFGQDQQPVYVFVSLIAYFVLAIILIYYQYLREVKWIIYKWIDKNKVVCYN